MVRIRRVPGSVRAGPEKARVVRSSNRAYSWKAPCWRFWNSTPPGHSMRTQFPSALAESTPTARQAPETAVLCGLSNHRLWTGHARRNLLIRPSEHTNAWQLSAPPPPCAAAAAPLALAEVLLCKITKIKIITTIKIIQILIK